MSLLASYAGTLIAAYSATPVVNQGLILPTPPSDENRLVRYASQSGNSGNSGSSEGSAWSLGHALDQAEIQSALGNRITIYLLGDFTPTGASEISGNGFRGSEDVYGVVLRNKPNSPRSKITPINTNSSPLQFSDCNWFWVYGIEVDGSNKNPAVISSGISNSFGTHHARFTNITSHGHSANGWDVTGPGFGQSTGTNGCDWIIIEDSDLYLNGRSSASGASAINVVKMEAKGGQAGSDWTHVDGNQYGFIARRNRLWGNGQNVNSTALGLNYANGGHGLLLDRQTEFGYPRLNLLEQNASFLNWGRGLNAYRSHRLTSRFNTAVYNSQHVRYSGATPDPGGYGEIIYSDGSGTFGTQSGELLSYGELMISDPTLSALPNWTSSLTFKATVTDAARTVDAKYSALDTAVGHGVSTTITSGISGDFNLVPSNWANNSPYPNVTVLKAFGNEAFAGVDLTALGEFIPPIDNLGSARRTGSTGHTLGALIAGSTQSDTYNTIYEATY